MGTHPVIINGYCRALLAKVRQQAAGFRPQAIVFMTGEHFTNFFTNWTRRWKLPVVPIVL